MKEEILGHQKEALDARRSEASAELRGQRDEIYSALLKTHQEQRHDLSERQSQGLRSYALFDEIYPVQANDRSDEGPNDLSLPSPER